MSTILNPNDNYLIISFEELRNAWLMLSTPEKVLEVEIMIHELKALNAKTLPARTIFSLVAGSAWLTTDDEGIGSRSSVG